MINQTIEMNNFDVEVAIPSFSVTVEKQDYAVRTMVQED